MRERDKLKEFAREIAEDFDKPLEATMRPSGSIEIGASRKITGGSIGIELGNPKVDQNDILVPAENPLD